MLDGAKGRPPSSTNGLHDGEDYVGGELRVGVDALGGFYEIGGGGLVDAGDKFLGVAID